MTELPYNSVWASKEPPYHNILVGMCYRYYDQPKYFTLLIDGDGRSKLFSEEFIRTHYQQKEKQK